VLYTFYFNVHLSHFAFVRDTALFYYSVNLLNPCLRICLQLSAMQAGTSNWDREFEDMTSNDSGVESSTDNDDCAQPRFNKRLVSSAEMSLVPVRRMKNHDFPLSLCLNSISEPPIVFARPIINEIPGRKFKCLFELANPAFPSTLDRFQSVSIAYPSPCLS